MKNLDGRTLFGITLKENNVMKKESYKDYFEELEYYDETLLLKFKEEFENDFWDEDKPIKYHMLLEFWSDEECNCGMNLYMMPTLDYISKDIIQKIADDNDVHISDINERDILDNNIVPILMRQNIDFAIEGEWYTKEVVELLETATSVIPMIDRLIGFYLDKTINMIGTTNWDCLDGLLDGEP